FFFNNKTIKFFFFFFCCFFFFFLFNFGLFFFFFFFGFFVGLIRGGVGGVRPRDFVVLLGLCWFVLRGGHRPPPKRLEAAGFTFRWYDLEEALGDVVQ
ncbi:DUF1731 domain-containing protein, partial [Enterobacter hormaechei]